MTASVDSEAAAPPSHQRGPPYEIHRDAFLYFAMGEHLRFLAMDFPPVVAMLFGVKRGLLGDSIFRPGKVVIPHGFEGREFEDYSGRGTPSAIG